MTGSLKFAEYQSLLPLDQGHCDAIDPAISDALCLQFLHHSPCPDPEILCQGEGICPPCSWRQVELETTEANACRKGGVAACATHVYPVLIRLIVKDNA